STFHTVLAITSIIWQIVVLSKSWKVSNTAINEIFLNECLRDEIERHEQTKERLQYLATHDNLTGLPTRRFLMDRLDYMIKRSLRYEKMIVVMFVDLDGFKEINDLYGHESGDFALIEISNRLASTIRDTDIVARLGGDEFVLVYTDIDGGTAEAERLAQRILKLLNSPINLNNEESRQVTGSIGIALYPGSEKDSKALIKSADDAMYSAKAKGKNSYTFADN
ncbi:MAG: GGDEF domain-containing protein, partial [Gammaproteobacteria bacterium]|nr:GGDEF domain-containing protein [Gammaproteobacteria bacterium]